MEIVFYKVRRRWWVNLNYTQTHCAVLLSLTRLRHKFDTQKLLRMFQRKQLLRKFPYAL